MGKTGLIMMLVLALGALPVTAKIYRYTDADGTVCFTDDLSRVPVHQRKSLQADEAHVGPEKKEPQATPKKKPKAMPGKKTAILKPAKTGLLKQLETEQAKLNDKYAVLLKRKNELDKAGKQISDKAAMIAHGREVLQLNEEIKIYNRKRAELNKAIEAHNQSVK